MLKPELSSLQCLDKKREIICWMDDTFSFTVKRTKQGTIVVLKEVVLKEGKKTFKLTIERLVALSDLFMEYFYLTYKLLEQKTQS